MSTEVDPDYAEALKVVRTFIGIVQRHVDEDDNLAIALVSTGAALMASSRGVEPAIEALQDAIRELRQAGGR